MGLRDISFTDFFTIDKVGLEYEPELAIFFNSPVPTACSITIEMGLFKYYDIDTVNYISIAGDKYWKLVKVRISQRFLLIIDYEKFQELAKNYGFISCKGFSITDLYTGNFEIRTKALSTIDEAIDNANLEYNILVKILFDLKIPKFALITSGLRAVKNIFEGGYALRGTKHLNISGEVAKKYFNFSKKVGICNFIRSWFNLNYPHYFKYCNNSNDSSDSIENTTGFLIKDEERIHLKLPYKFKDYDKLLQGTAVLPDIKEIFNYQDKKENIISYGTDYKNCEAQVLGRTYGSTWTHFHDLV